MSRIRFMSMVPPPALRWNEVPVEARELYILKGYRPLSVGVVKSLASAFALHNETLNIWTHALPLIYFAWWTILDLGDARSLQAPGSHHPLYAYIIGVLTLFAVSTGAHLLMSVSWRWRQVCFMLDYAAISFYGVATARAYYHYTGNTEHSTKWYLLATSAAALAATFACCWTRVSQPKSAHYIRTLSFFLPFAFASLPALSRLYVDAYFRLRFLKHVFLLVCGAAVKVSKVPERFAPGTFDIFGHSHQVFHVLVFLGIREQFWIVMDDVKQVESSSSSSPISAFGPLAVLAALMLITLAFFSARGDTPKKNK
ncbi:unnamed protein product [Dimorphilus gyrociliatus]|uniref:Uncharacterized protein n=1 Tax=Dimorphilus gyrociliatus TaxID=2664684 RepID=A0A7I8W4C7_9ANNE|nr:unnamed protein product [Dimorphilus gyrociliatus]